MMDHQTILESIQNDAYVEAIRWFIRLNLAANTHELGVATTKSSSSGGTFTLISANLETREKKNGDGQWRSNGGSWAGPLIDFSQDGKFLAQSPSLFGRVASFCYPFDPYLALPPAASPPRPLISSRVFLSLPYKSSAQCPAPTSHHARSFPLRATRAGTRKGSRGRAVPPHPSPLPRHFCW
ncbi:hypothetical protein ZWY2020_042647 [Hordeum vulgare]|nr:hypothetical protein ZWY2020_042647 [Hordeum vulgare]